MNRDRMAVVKEVTTDGLKLQFYDGDTSTTQKSYKRLASYQNPLVDDIVQTKYIGGTYIVQGKVI